MPKLCRPRTVCVCALTTHHPPNMARGFEKRTGARNPPRKRKKNRAGRAAQARQDHGELHAHNSHPPPTRNRRKLSCCRTNAKLPVYGGVSRQHAIPVGSSIGYAVAATVAPGPLGKDHIILPPVSNGKLPIESKRCRGGIERTFHEKTQGVSNPRSPLS